MVVQSFTLADLELNGEPLQLIGAGELSVNVQYVSSNVPGLKAWVVMAVLDGSQAHRFLPTDRPLTLRTQTTDGKTLSGQVYPHNVQDTGGSTSVELQGAGHLEGYEPKT